MDTDKSHPGFAERVEGLSPRLCRGVSMFEAPSTCHPILRFDLMLLNTTENKPFLTGYLFDFRLLNSRVGTREKVLRWEFDLAFYIAGFCHCLFLAAHRQCWS